jgi:hypothetical protein
MTSDREGISRRSLFKGVGLAAVAGALSACSADDDPAVVGGGVFRGRVLEYWVQLENSPWDAAPWNVDRATGQPLASGAGPYLPASEEVLRIRRYTANWAAPMDAPVNPWDLTEPDPAVTNGGLPGAVLHGRVGDRLIVHFRNRDARAGKTDAERTHSLHPHGVQRTVLYDGAYPLSPPDPAQGGARGDRVPPGGAFTYVWTCPQQAAAGTWLYHDASVTGWRMGDGAFGALVIWAPGEPEGDQPPAPVGGPGAPATSVAPPERGDYLLVFHELPGVGLCLNGRRGLGNTPALLAAPGTRMTVRALNATETPLALYIAGHRWQQAGRGVDAELLTPGGGATLSILSGSFAEGGGPGEWLITGRAGAQTVQASLVVSEGGAVAPAAG